MRICNLRVTVLPEVNRQHESGGVQGLVKFGAVDAAVVS